MSAAYPKMYPEISRRGGGAAGGLRVQCQRLWVLWSCQYFITWWGEQREICQPHSD